MMTHKISFRERGQGPLLLLLHGYGGSVHHWESVAETLSHNYRVVVPNLSHLYLSHEPLGFHQQVDVFAQFLQEHFPNEKVHVAALSFGGAIAWGVAAKYPHLVKKLVLINPMVADPIKNFLPLELRFFFTVPLNLKSIYVMLSTPMGRTFMKRAAQIFRDERAEGSAVAIETLKGRKLQFVAHLIHRFAWILRSEPWGEWTRNLLNYRGDCRLVYDEEDLLFDGTSYRKFAYYIGCEDIITTKGAGHLAIKTCPDLIAKHIKDFLEHRRAA